MKLSVYFIFCILLITTSCKIKSADSNDEALNADSDSTDTSISAEMEEELDLHETFNEVILNLDERLKPFVHKDYEAIDLSSGDLNLDGLDDRILVLRKKTEASTSNYSEDKPDKRQMLLLLGQKDSTFKLAFKNENVAYCIDCGGIYGDPFVGTSIGKGTFIVEHGVAGGDHWEQFHTFKFDNAKNNWFLEKNHYIHYALGSEDFEESEALTADVDKLKTAKDFGIVSFEKFNIYNQTSLK